MELQVINEEAERSAGLISQATAQAAAIKDGGSYNDAADLTASVKRAIRQLEAVGSPLVAKTWAAYKEAKALLDARLRPLQEAESILKRGLRTYDDQIEQERRAAELAAQRRLEQEQARKRAEELRQETEKANLERALAAEAAGQKEQVEKILAEPLPDLPAPPVSTPPAPPPARPVAAGVTFRDNWKAEVTDLAALVSAAAGNPRLLSFLSVNQAVLNAMARTEKEKLQIPGVRVFNDRIVSQRI